MYVTRQCTDAMCVLAAMHHPMVRINLAVQDVKRWAAWMHTVNSLVRLTSQVMTSQILCTTLQSLHRTQQDGMQVLRAMTTLSIILSIHITLSNLPHHRAKNKLVAEARLWHALIIPAFKALKLAGWPAVHSPPLVKVIIWRLAFWDKRVWSVHTSLGKV